MSLWAVGLEQHHSLSSRIWESINKWCLVHNLSSDKLPYRLSRGFILVHGGFYSQDSMTFGDSYVLNLAPFVKESLRFVWLTLNLDLIVLHRLHLLSQTQMLAHQPWSPSIRILSLSCKPQINDVACFIATDSLPMILVSTQYCVFTFCNTSSVMHQLKILHHCNDRNHTAQL